MKLITLLACIIALLCGANVARGHDMSLHILGIGPSYVGYQHDKYHEPYKRLTEFVNGVLGPGDHGYRSDEFNDTYRQLYSQGKCACKSGYCRPTNIRITELGSPTGFDILVSGVWIPVPQESLHNERTLPRELWEALMKDADAHVCAYPDASKPYGFRIECAIVPDRIG